MTPGFCTDHIIKTNFFKVTRNLLKNFCNLDIEFVNIHGEAVLAEISNLQPQISVTNRIASRFNEENFSTATLVEKCIIDQTLENKSTISYICPKRFTKILVPVVFRDQVIGFLHTGETESSRLSKPQINSAAAFLEELVQQITNNELKLAQEYNGDQTTHQQKMINKALKYIENNYHSTELSLSAVSKKQNISYHYLSRLFKQELKTTFPKYLNKLRIDVASRLLKDKSLSINQISYSCGFTDPGYFCKIFKKSQGATPLEFRNKPSLSLKYRKAKSFIKA